MLPGFEPVAADLLCLAAAFAAKREENSWGGLTRWHDPNKKKMVNRNIISIVIENRLYIIFLILLSEMIVINMQHFLYKFISK